MRWIHRERLRSLLWSEAKYDWSAIFIQAFDAMRKSNLQSYEGGSPAPRRAILEIYERRATYDPCPSRGFEDLLPALRAATDSQVRLHSFMVDGTDYVMFTNAATTELYGILAVDVSRQLREGWYDKRGRWNRRLITPRRA